MEMQPPSEPVPAMADYVPKVVDQQSYTERTHFTPGEEKAAWEPHPEVGSVTSCKLSACNFDLQLRL
jgi:hypothetical protein